MRHFILSSPITTAALGMGVATATGLLVAFPRFAHGATAHRRCALGTVALAMVTATANQHLFAALGTEE